MLFPPSGYIFPPCIQSPEKSLNATVARSLILASAQHELQHFDFQCSCTQLSLCVSLSLPAISLSLPALCTSLSASPSAPLSLRLSPPRTLSLCFSFRPPRLPPSLSSPQPQLVFGLGFNYNPTLLLKGYNNKLLGKTLFKTLKIEINTKLLYMCLCCLRSI